MKFYLIVMGLFILGIALGTHILIPNKDTVKSQYSCICVDPGGEENWGSSPPLNACPPPGVPVTPCPKS